VVQFVLEVPATSLRQCAGVGDGELFEQTAGAIAQLVRQRGISRAFGLANGGNVTPSGDVAIAGRSYEPSDFSTAGYTNSYANVPTLLASNAADDIH
jgi:hypothetical protein